MQPAPTPVPELNAVLAELVSSAQDFLGKDFIGAYLQGSFALGDWDIHSDVDWLIVIRRDVDPAQLAALQALHGRIFDLPTSWAQHLEGSYFPIDWLRRPGPVPEALYYLDNTSRELVRDPHDNTLVARWVTREYGITLAGTPAVELIDPVPAAALRREVRATLRAWGEQILADPQQINNRWYQPFVVLSCCRMLHTLASGRIVSKPAGAGWAQNALDPRWRGLIKRAWAERPYPSLKVRQEADPGDLKATLAFIRDILEVSERYADEG